tara:strand:+ start:157 stop:762 length:606 start_codon:yes stop_codon:yes gene_type:complete
MNCTAIIDYGVGNVLSIKRSLDHVGVKSITTNNKKKIENCSHLILPGVGAFSSAMNLLKENKLDQVIKDFAKSGKPVLGICLGMQLLFEESYEFGKWKGLSILPGKVMKINIKNNNVPIVGWFKIESKKKNILEKYSGKYLYLVHSYECRPKRKKDVIGTYKINKNKISCAVKSKNILGFQFHPEKSSFDGLKILKDFCNL